MMIVMISLVLMFMLIVFMNKIYILLIYEIYIFLILMYVLFFFSLNNLLGCWIMIYLNFGVDLYSWGLLILMIWIVLMSLMISFNFLDLNYVYYLMLMNLLMLVLWMLFFSMNFLMFYILFELSLLPLFLLILGWGYQVDRINASFYMLMYTIFGSLPLFYMIVWIYMLNKTLMYMLLNLSINLMNFFMLIMAFLIKMPLYLTHLWLPKAHVEAPVVGSMILAGIMLKLGSYGLLRLFMTFNYSMNYMNLMIMFSLLGGIISSFVCIYQTDMKLLVAYSSVVHMNLMISGMFTHSNWGILGGYLMMLSHGLSSSGLFSLVGLIYDRLKTRSLMLSKGLISIFPSLSLMWFLIFSSNVSFPPSLNLFSEIFLLNSLILYNKNFIFLLMLYCFFSALYMIYLYSYSQHGKYLLMFNNLNIYMGEYFMLLLHWIPLNLMFMYMYMFV